MAEEQIASGSYDGYVSSVPGYNNDQTDIYVGHNGTYTFDIFLLFTTVPINAGSTVLSAKIQLRASANLSGASCNVKIHFEDADNPTSAPSSYANYFSRSITSGVTWTIPSFTSGTWYDSPDLSSELQKIIDRPGWALNNNIGVQIRNDSSTSGAYRQASSYNSSATYAVKLVFTSATVKEGDFSDGSGIGDLVDSFSLSVPIDDSAGLSDAVDGYDYKGIAEDGIGAGDLISSNSELPSSIADAAGISDLCNWSWETNSQTSDIAGIGDAADAFNWTDWIAENLDKSIVRYYCTITGDADGTTDIEIPISSFQARKQNENATYLSVVIPGVAYADQIDARSNGDIVIDMAYLIDGTESQREEIVRAELEQINIQEGPNSRSISLIGHKDQTFVAKESRLYDPIYKARTDGALSYRFAVPDLWLNPGDTAQVDDDEFTVDTVIYMVSAGGQTTMEVQELA